MRRTRALFVFFICYAQIPFVISVHANQELDKLYALDTVGVLKAYDNVDGLFAEYVTAGAQDYFQQHQSRFTYVDLSKANQILGASKLSYAKVIEDRDILLQVARSMRLQSIIRTKVSKEGPRYRFILEWLHAPSIALMVSETFTLEEPADGKSFGIGDVRKQISLAIERLVRKLPFLGKVTGRDRDQITVNVGERANVASGDTLILGTLEEVKIHPILKQVVDWRFVQTGRVRVVSVDDGLAFTRLREQAEGKQIVRHQKVIEVIPAKDERDDTEDDGGGVHGDGTKQDAKGGSSTEDGANSGNSGMPSYGWLGAGVGVGNLSRDYSSGGTTSVGRTGGGTLIGFRGMGELWLTRDWFAELQFAYGFAGYSQQNTSSGLAVSPQGASATIMSTRIAVGYNYFPTGDFYGPRVFTKFGFRNTSINLPAAATDYTADAAVNSFFAGVGGDLALRGDWGILLNLDFGLFKGSSISDPSDPASEIATRGATDVGFLVGTYYRLDRKMTIRFTGEFNAIGADFANGGSVRQKAFNIGPAFLFYF